MKQMRKAARQKDEDWALNVFDRAPFVTMSMIRPDGTWQVKTILNARMRCITDRRTIMKKIGIVMGSDSDLPIAEKAVDTLKELGVPFEVHVYSAHRTPVEAAEFSRTAKEKGFGAIIAFAGKAAHLAGSLAANTCLPVIGVPVKSSNLDGIDALLSTVQMPSGIPVATVAIDGAVNAALLSCQMIAIEDDELAAKLQAKREADAKKVLAKDADISSRF